MGNRWCLDTPRRARRSHGDPTLIFLSLRFFSQKQGKPTEKARIFLSRRTPKILGREEKTIKKRERSSNRVLESSRGQFLETERIRFQRARFQTPNSVSYFGPSASSGERAQCVCQSKLTELFANSPTLPQNSVRLSEFSSPKQRSRNSIPPVS